MGKQVYNELESSGLKIYLKNDIHKVVTKKVNKLYKDLPEKSVTVTTRYAVNPIVFDRKTVIDFDPE